eukprot:TRINITY_DN815_c1_g1_i1.p1 TRINITY_DN815_c1_g1~~TRINITY_DN815_c1_g1_i1.p1  ORF type:complete len:1215 (-),score=309.56 TRINITY_DN815_c1_g1_i1:20-3664(-)
MADNKRWCNDLLTRELGFDSADIVEHILTFRTEAQLDEYLRDLLGPASSIVKQIVERLFPKPVATGAAPTPGARGKARGGKGGAESGRGRGEKAPSRGIGPGRGVGVVVGGGGGGGEKPAPTPAARGRGKTQPVEPPKPVVVPESAQFFVKADVADDFWGKGNAAPAPKKGKKKSNQTEYAEFVAPSTQKQYSVAGTPVFIKKKKGKADNSSAQVDRMLCGCQGTVHPFVNNCLECGRICCELEGAGPCHHCGTHVNARVHAPEESTTQLPSGTFQRKTIANSKTVIYGIIDDQQDYYNLNDTWLTKEEKKKLEEKERKRLEANNDRTNRITIDFTGRRIVSNQEEDYQFEKEMVEVTETLRDKKVSSSDFRKRARETTSTKAIASASDIARKKRSFLESDAPPSVLGKRIQHEYFPDVEGEDLGIDFEQIRTGDHSKAKVPAAMPIRGVFERTHSGLWTQEERKDFLNWTADHGATHYFYAAKGDPYTRKEWRDEYPSDDAQVKCLADLHTTASKKSVVVTYVLEVTGIELNQHRSESKYISDKILGIHKATGIKSFTLVFPDASLSSQCRVPAEFKTLAETHATIFKQVLANLKNLPELSWFIRPAYHFSKFGSKSDDFDTISYLSELNKDIPEPVVFLWSGTSPRPPLALDADHFNIVCGIAKNRKIVLLENIPDNRHAPNLVFLTPYSGRPADLSKYLEGILLHPMPLVAPSKVTIGTGLKYMSSPSQYNSLSALSQVLSALIKEEAIASIVAEFIKISPSYPVQNNRPRVINSGGREECQWFDTHTLNLAKILRRGPNEKKIEVVFPEFDKFSSYFELLETFLDTNVTFFNWKKDKQIAIELSDKLRKFEELLLPYYSDSYAKSLHHSLASIKLPNPYDITYKKLLEECTRLSRQQTSLKQSSGFVRNGAKHILEEMSTALRNAEKFVRPSFSDKEIEARRRFLNALFYGETIHEQLPISVSITLKTTLDSKISSPPPGKANPTPKIGPGANKGPTLATTPGAKAEQKKEKKQKSGPSLPPGCKYVPSFLTAAEAGQLLTFIDTQFWDKTLKRRTQQYGWEYNYGKAYSNEDKSLSRLSPTKAIPHWLNSLCQKLVNENYFPVKPDQIIVNEYTPGQGIAPHIDHDGSFDDWVACISLISGVTMNFQKSAKETKSVYLMPGSLLLMTGEGRYEWTHGIDSVVSDVVRGQTVLRRRRVSVTFRKIKGETN